MRKIIANTFVTLDGIMQAPGGPEEDPTGGFKWGGWSVNYWDVWIFPVVIGTGKRLFGDGTIPSGLKLVDSKVSTTGVIIATYEPAGEIKLGSVELDKPTEAELARRKRLAEEG